MTAFFFIYPPFPLWFDLILAAELNRELNQVNRMNVTANIVCYKSKTLSNGEHPLMIRVCKDGKKKYKGFRICHTLGYKFHYWTVTFGICCGYIVADAYVAPLDALVKLDQISAYGRIQVKYSSVILTQTLNLIVRNKARCYQFFTQTSSYPFGILHITLFAGKLLYRWSFTDPSSTRHTGIQ